MHFCILGVSPKKIELIFSSLFLSKRWVSAIGLEFRDARMPTWPSDAEVSTLCKCMKLDTLSVFQKEVAGGGDLLDQTPKKSSMAP